MFIWWSVRVLSSIKSICGGLAGQYVSTQWHKSSIKTFHLPEVVVVCISVWLKCSILSPCLMSWLIILSCPPRCEQLRSQDAQPPPGGEWERMSSPMLPPPVSWNMGTVRPRSSDQKHRQTVWPPAKMFYPELSPAMRWHLDHNQKMYNMQMFSHQFSDKFSDQYGKSGRGRGTNNIKVECIVK